MDAVRSEYRELSAMERMDIATIKSIGNTLIEYIDAAFQTSTRESSLAKTKVEEAVMWAVKGITG